MKTRPRPAAADREFHIGDILSAYTGFLLSPSGIGGVYEILNFMHCANLFTHQLPRAADDARPWLLESLPWLKNVTCKEVTRQNARQRLAHYVATYGEFHRLSPIPHAEELHRDPMAELDELIAEANAADGREPRRSADLDVNSGQSQDGSQADV